MKSPKNKRGKDSHFGKTLPLLNFNGLAKDLNGTKELLLLVLVHEALNAAFGVHELCFAGVEGVAHGANFDFDVCFGCASFDHASACAADLGFNVFRVKFLFHKN